MRGWSTGALIAVLIGLTVAFGFDAAQAAASAPNVRVELTIACIELAIDAEGVAVAISL